MKNLISNAISERYRRIFGYLTVFSTSLILLGCSGRVSEEELKQELVFKPVDPLEKIFKETAFFREIAPITHVARGEHATFQWVVRSMEEYIEGLKLEVVDLSYGENVLSNIKVGYVGYVSVGRNTPNHSRDRLRPNCRIELQASSRDNSSPMSSNGLSRRHQKATSVWNSRSIWRSWPRLKSISDFEF